MSDSLNGLREKINQSYRMDETIRVDDLLSRIAFSEADKGRITHRAMALIAHVRRHPGDRTLLEDFMQRYALSTDEGIALMGLAESLLRIPDSATADALVVDKISHGHWDHNAEIDKKMVTTLSGWGLSLSEQVLHSSDTTFGRLVKRMGVPVIRQAVMQAVKLLGGQFVSGRTLKEALDNSDSGDAKSYLHSFDMLGEGARTALKANEYFIQYQHAIETLGKAQAKKDKDKTLFAKDSISVKLSALHPRYEEAQKALCLPVMIERVRELAVLAKTYDVMLTLDAEEADRLELSLDIFEAVFADDDLKDFQGFGLAVQAYQKRCPDVMAWLIALAHEHGKMIPVRLVKGAYWDSEIKKAQERGLSGYPVYTRKVNTDVSYLAVADQMLRAPHALYPQFATHNATTISAILELAARHNHTSFEFQRLHGMGEPLYEALSSKDLKNLLSGYVPPCRVYAPVGQYQELLPYLVRRLLENGANSSFVNHIYDERISPEKLARDPLSEAGTHTSKAHPSIPLPAHIFSERRNSVTFDLSDRQDQAHIRRTLDHYKAHQWHAGPVFGKDHIAKQAARIVSNPAETNQKVGDVQDISPEAIDGVMSGLNKAWESWNKTSLDQRAAILHKMADQYEKHQDELLALCVYEAGKTIPDALAEIREAIDFCRYYAAQALLHLAPHPLPGPVGEQNILHHEGRGVWVCISPWNFPLAIFTGQIVAALVAGNCVAAKPAPQTCLIAARAVQLMYEAGLPDDVLALLPGDGEVGKALTAHKWVAGVAFTGSTATAWHIQRSLSDKQGPLVPFIAETGGQNAMIVDSSALPEQVVDDIVRSAFLSAGQRCSALRVLYVQDDIAPTVLNMLRGAMSELHMGNPADLATDIGPVIDEHAKARLNHHLDVMPMPLMEISKTPSKGTFVTPTVLPLKKISDLTEEHFGPILHVIHFTAEQKPQIIDHINAYGYGLTLGIHSRIESFIHDVVQRARVGNVYVNRSMIGAVVGVQPFGGMGMSGTGPKAGGPDYLKRFAIEKTVTVNITAIGGNTILANLD